MKLVKTVKCKLEVDEEQRQPILDTIAKFTQACNDALALAQKHKLWNAYKLHYRCYYQLKARYGLHANYIEYKALEKGIAVVYVSPQYTSQRCPKCGHIEGSNRNGQRFCCQKCGYENFADYIAPFNIRQVYIDAGGWASVNTLLSSPAESQKVPTLGTASLAL